MMNPMTQALTVGELSARFTLITHRKKGVDETLAGRLTVGTPIGLITMDDVLGVTSEQLRGRVGAIASEQQLEERLRA
jgi:hypothetical protein